MTKNLRWRMPDTGKLIDPGEASGTHIPALARAFGHYPITLEPKHERELRAMAALWGSNEGNPYYSIANLISAHGMIVLFLEEGPNG